MRVEAEGGGWKRFRCCPPTSPTNALHCKCQPPLKLLCIESPMWWLYPRGLITLHMSQRTMTTAYWSVQSAHCTLFPPAGCMLFTAHCCWLSVQTGAPKGSKHLKGHCPSQAEVHNLQLGKRTWMLCIYLMCLGAVVYTGPEGDLLGVPDTHWHPFCPDPIQLRCFFVISLVCLIVVWVAWVVWVVSLSDCVMSNLSDSFDTMAWIEWKNEF